MHACSGELKVRYCRYNAFMKIAIDARMLYWTGIGRYTKALLDELEQIDAENTYVVLMRKADWGLWEPTAPNFTKVEASVNPYTLGEQWAFYLQLRALGVDLVHFTAPNTPLLYQGRRVVTIHDLTLVDYDTSRGRGLAKLLRSAKRLPFRLVFWNNTRFATQLLADTDYVHDQLVERFGAKNGQVRTTLLAVDPNVAEPAPIERFGALGRYVFYIGNVYPYKNLISTLLAMVALGEAHEDVKMVVAGKRDAFSAELEREAAQLGLSERVKFVGYVSDGEMISLYRGAAAYVNPSLSEGFGLQGLEAMAQGVPVVASKASCLPEVYGEAAEYFDAKDAGDQAAALGRVLEDKARADKLRAAGLERVKAFSWRRMAEQTLKAYEAAGEGQVTEPKG